MSNGILKMTFCVSAATLCDCCWSFTCHEQVEVCILSEEVDAVTILMDGWKCYVSCVVAVFCGIM